MMSSTTYRGPTQDIYMLTPQYPKTLKPSRPSIKLCFHFIGEKIHNRVARWIPCRREQKYVQAQSRRAFLSRAPRPLLSAVPALGRISYSGTLWELSSRWSHGHRRFRVAKVSPSAASDDLCPTPLDCTFWHPLLSSEEHVLNPYRAI
jgi:hypothetical protein